MAFHIWHQPTVVIIFIKCSYNINCLVKNTNSGLEIWKSKDTFLSFNVDRFSYIEYSDTSNHSDALLIVHESGFSVES